MDKEDDLDPTEILQGIEADHEKEKQHRRGRVIRDVVGDSFKNRAAQEVEIKDQPND